MLKRTLLVAMVAVLVLPVAVLAQNDGSSGDSSSSSTGTTTQSDQRQEDRANRQAERQQRLADRAAAIDEARTTIITERCQAAQAKLDETLTRINAIYENRQSKYADIINKINSLLTRFQSNGIGTLDLDIEVAELQTKVGQFFGSFDAFVLTLDDAISMDCVENPEDFQLALEDARQKRSELVAKSNEINSYVRDTILVTLQEIRATLASSESNSNETETNQTEGTESTGEVEG